MRIIFDNNIWISFLIGKRISSLRSVFSRKDVEIFFKDVYLLALSDAVKADLLISGDSDLTDMQCHNQTRIVDLNTALSLLTS